MKNTAITPNLRIISRVKRAVGSAINLLGYEVVRKGHLETLVADLAHCAAMRKIHCNDAVEIEELYHKFVFPDLPRRAGRAELLNELIGTSIGEAIYMIHYLHEAVTLPGDVCEFGVAQGATSALLAAELLSIPERKLWLFDSFEGLPAPGPEDKLIDDIFGLGSMSSYEGEMASPESKVRNRLQSIGFPETRIKVKKGWVKETINSSDLPDRVAFAYVDLDLYSPIKDALEFLDRHMQPGGRIIVDDYRFFSEGAELAVDQFVSKSGNRFKSEVPLPFAGHFCILSKIC